MALPSIVFLTDSVWWSHILYFHSWTGILYRNKQNKRNPQIPSRYCWIYILRIQSNCIISSIFPVTLQSSHVYFKCNLTLSDSCLWNSPCVQKKVSLSSMLCFNSNAMDTTKPAVMLLFAYFTVFWRIPPCSHLWYEYVSVACNYKTSTMTIRTT